jgi:hypothetical protein
MPEHVRMIGGPGAEDGRTAESSQTVAAVASYFCDALIEVTAADRMMLNDQLERHVRRDRDELRSIAAVGIVRRLWRNTRIEDEHGGPHGRISDAEMFAANVSTRRIILERIEDDPSDWIELARSVAAPGRVVAGRTVRDLLGPSYQEWCGEVFAEAAALGAPELDADGVILANAYLSIASPPWWGLPSWPDIVDRFLGSLEVEPPLPMEELRDGLLAGPDDLDLTVLQWCIDHEIAYA